MKYTKYKMIRFTIYDVLHFIRSINITLKCNETANETNYNMVTTSGVWKKFESVSYRLLSPVGLMNMTKKSK